MLNVFFFFFFSFENSKGYFSPLVMSYEEKFNGFILWLHMLKNLVILGSPLVKYEGEKNSFLIKSSFTSHFSYSIHEFFLAIFYLSNSFLTFFNPQLDVFLPPILTNIIYIDIYLFIIMQ